MLKVFSGILLISGAFGAVAQSGESGCLERARNKGEELSCKVKIIPSYYPALSHEQSGSITLFGESMFSEKEVDCRMASMNKDWYFNQAIPGLRHIATGGDFSESVTGPVKTSVSGAWMRFGLVLGNNNVGEGAHTLIIDYITLTARGKYESQVFNHVQTLGPGYCDAPFLYVVSPGNTLDYRPFSDNPQENLTLYLDGIPYLVSSASGSPERIIPAQEMELTLLGRFISEDGSKVKLFFKRIGLRTPLLHFVKTNEPGDSNASSWVLAPNR